MQSTDADQPITDVSKSTQAYFKRHPMLLVSLVVLIAGGLIPIISTFVLPFIGNGQSSFGNAGIDIGIFPIIGAVILYNYIRGRVEAEFLGQFAAANGYTFSEDASSAGMAGLVFKIGHSPKTYDMVSGSYLNYPIKLFLYRYTVGYGKYAHTYQYTIFQLQFDTVMPDLVLINVGHVFGAPLLTNTSFNGQEHISLEGDFNKYFSLNVSKGYEIEALEVFTPDVMTILVQKCQSLSLEIVGNSLFIYSEGLVGTEEKLIGLYGAAQYFSQELGPVLARMKPSLVAEESMPHA